MTNRVYFLSLKNPSPSDQIHTILVRLYGKSNISIQREKEMEIAKLLSTKELAPKWFLSFANGRIEEYLNCQSVTSPSFRSLSTASQIIANLAKIHALLPNLVSGGIFPEENYIWRIFDDRRNQAADAFQTMLRLYQPVQSGDETTLASYSAPLSMLQSIQNWNPFQSEKVELLKESILKINSPLVYAHCDVHHGNVIQLKADKTDDSGSKGNSDEMLMIIDFEYGIPAPRGYDLANLFCEFCGDYDSSDGIPAHEMNFSLYPSLETRRQLLELYFQSFAENSDKIFQEKLIEELESEIRVYLPLVHLQWANWGIIKAANDAQRGILMPNDSSFDYLRYAYQRYYEWHQELLKYQFHSSLSNNLPV